MLIMPDKYQVLFKPRKINMNDGIFSGISCRIANVANVFGEKGPSMFRVPKLQYCSSNCSVTSVCYICHLLFTALLSSSVEIKITE